MCTHTNTLIGSHLEAQMCVKSACRNKKGGNSMRGFHFIVKELGGKKSGV